MRAAQNASLTVKNAGGHHSWSSPMPYLFGGLALMVFLIAAALLLLACSYSRSTHNSQSSPPSDDGAEEKPPNPIDVLRPEMEPRVVVIMAGDHNPTFLAKPVPNNAKPREEV